MQCRRFLSFLRFLQFLCLASCAVGCRFFPRTRRAWPCLYEKNTDYLCLWLWGLGYGMLFTFRYVSMRLRLIYDAFSKRSVTFAEEIKSYHEKYGTTKQFRIFLSVARSRASFLQKVDSQISYLKLQQIYAEAESNANELAQFALRGVNSINEKPRCHDGDRG